jgi:hypothetical protein
VIHQVFPLEQAAEAHALMESSAHVGKIMLQVSAPLQRRRPGVRIPTTWNFIKTNKRHVSFV